MAYCSGIFESGPDKWSNPLLSFNLFRKSKENGAPGMQPNLYKVVYYQWLSKVHFWKSGLLQID